MVSRGSLRLSMIKEEEEEEEEVEQEGSLVEDILGYEERGGGSPFYLVK